MIRWTVQKRACLGVIAALVAVACAPEAYDP